MLLLNSLQSLFENLPSYLFNSPFHILTLKSFLPRSYVFWLKNIQFLRFFPLNCFVTFSLFSITVRKCFLIFRTIFFLEWHSVQIQKCTVSFSASHTHMSWYHSMHQLNFIIPLSVILLSHVQLILLLCRSTGFFLFFSIHSDVDRFFCFSPLLPWR